MWWVSVHWERRCEIGHIWNWCSVDFVNQLLPVCQQPWWSGYNDPASFWAICSQVYVWIWILLFVPISRINLQEHRRKAMLLFFFISCLNGIFSLYCEAWWLLRLLFQPCGISAFKRFWKACFKSPFYISGKMAKLGNVCAFSFNYFGMS